MDQLRNDFIAVLSLFTSFSTLLCCASPALLVTLGLGVVMAGLASNLPFLATLTKYKELTLFLATGIIGFNFWMVYGKKGKDTSCAVPDNNQEPACETASRWSKIVLWISFVFLLIGAFMTYLALPLTVWLKS